MTMNFNPGGAVGAVNAIDALGGVQAVRRREGSSAGGDHGGQGGTFSNAMRDARADSEATQASSQTTRGPDKARKDEDKSTKARDDDTAAAPAAPAAAVADAAPTAPDPVAASGAVAQAPAPDAAAAGAAVAQAPVGKTPPGAEGPVGAEAAMAALRAGCGLPALAVAGTGVGRPGTVAGKAGAQGATPTVGADPSQVAVSAVGGAATATAKAAVAAATTATATAAQTLPGLTAGGDLPAMASAAGFQLPAGPGQDSPGNAGVSETRVKAGLNAGKALPASAAASARLTTELPATATVQLVQTVPQTQDWATLKVQGIRLQSEPGAGPSSTVDLAAAVQAGASMSLVQKQSSSEAPAPSAQAAIAIPLDAPEFAGALAKQVGYWINGGIQNAEIHLNPAEMGPISVQMSLQGGDARVDFSAVSAQTRQVLQDSIPQLAQMLEQAGMSLLSADVSAQQGRSQQRDTARQGSPSGGSRAGVQALDALGSASAASTATLSRPRPSAPGRLDLYA